MKRLFCAFLPVILLLAWLPVSAAAAPLEIKAKSALLMDVTTGTVLFATPFSVHLNTVVVFVVSLSVIV